MLPRAVTLSKAATDKFRMMKGMTGVTPNILARMALMLAVEDGTSLKNASVSDSDGQVLSKDVLFGEYAAAYEAVVLQYISEVKINKPMQEVIVSLIEAGAHKMGHVKSLADLLSLKA
ncbi:hypothetical protein A3193_03675 [Candidatus Thiodiazotropha endoloripes]|uniref:DndE family protein n=1 Tax=Candidatus Thiodiazotropha endoloripes TaxID=1818881 RepID=UPI00083DE5E6|nr:DndE family protein [Candidatus Thiodiazotropha endoloripes]ODB88004.1 hypothetical protein A3193_03675 [Candidatus Thiodiazotropha endoloripes]